MGLEPGFRTAEPQEGEIALAKPGGNWKCMRWLCKRKKTGQGQSGERIKEYGTGEDRNNNGR